MATWEDLDSESGSDKDDIDEDAKVVVGCNAIFYLFNYLIEFRFFLNNLFDLW